MFIETVRLPKRGYVGNRNFTMTTRHKNRKTIYLLVALFVFVGVHYALAIAYNGSYTYVKNNYQDAEFGLFAYQMTLLSITGVMGIAFCRTALLRVLFGLLPVPNGLFLAALSAAYQVNSGPSFVSLQNYHDYLLLLPFAVDALLLAIFVNLLSEWFNEERAS
ncbi:hypothetical protein [Hymenobacter cellulosilyticus]|uniref:Uncharacterized protein n=1 Tax=Hymenobacter cellulosilyticus TaxID=2932248 RepID=A0A8T9QFQ6_9BACT|nr:hypothetical protein [Hymenobacter cellulosilyticus]UOQ74389.1 hypothetical protein MUN79_11195 [Hymenobacter cellulosilyticus]